MTLREPTSDDHILAARFVIGALQDDDTQFRQSIQDTLVDSDLDTVMHVIGYLAVDASELLVNELDSKTAAIEHCQRVIAQLTLEAIDNDDKEN
ncbi:hypothetical protein [Curtobacterium sp. C2H10]|uniref:hypothetical protein n=1 Tax=Curtobacterium sp. C2H10 TaxID=2736664 RepID=UPI0021BF0399|nr:hypothetical protein [Curtobacterium sp. C2H10]MCT9620741.1 hypothetical protein [Curtobacterium sp. C2H10]